jgi:hypothetical protein
VTPPMTAAAATTVTIRTVSRMAWSNSRYRQIGSHHERRRPPGCCHTLPVIPGSRRRGAPALLEVTARSAGTRAHVSAETPAIVEWERGDLGPELVEVGYQQASKIIDYFRQRWDPHGQPLDS